MTHTATQTTGPAHSGMATLADGDTAIATSDSQQDTKAPYSTLPSKLSWRDYFSGIWTAVKGGTAESEQQESSHSGSRTGGDTDKEWLTKHGAGRKLGGFSPSDQVTTPGSTAQNPISDNSQTGGGSADPLTLPPTSTGKQSGSQPHPGSRKTPSYVFSPDGLNNYTKQIEARCARIFREGQAARLHTVASHPTSGTAFDENIETQSNASMLLGTTKAIGTQLALGWVYGQAARQFASVADAGARLAGSMALSGIKSAAELVL